MREDKPMAGKDKESGTKQAPEPSRIDPRLLEILVCPRTKTTLEYDAQNQELISRAAKHWRIRSATASQSCCRKKRARWMASAAAGKYGGPPRTMTEGWLE